MSEKLTVPVPYHPAVDLPRHFGVDYGSANDVLAELRAIFAKHEIDEETAVGIAKSYERHFGALDTPALRVKRFSDFIKSIKTKDGLLGTIQSMGLFSKAELENYAVDTGDWSHFLKRVEGEQEAKDE